MTRAEMDVPKKETVKKPKIQHAASIDGMESASCAMSQQPEQMACGCCGISGHVAPPASTGAGARMKKKLSLKATVDEAAAMQKPCCWAPERHGALIWLDDDGSCRMSFREDRHLSDIHPNIYVPSTLQNVKELGGGGSGVTVMQGEDEVFGDVVMKHCGHKDTAEIWALATVKAELRERSELLGAQEAAHGMHSRTPQFKFIYVSQNHLRARSGELWAKLRTVLKAVAMMSQSLSPNSKKRTQKPICVVHLKPEEMSNRHVDLVEGHLEIYRDDGGEQDSLECKSCHDGTMYLNQWVKQMLQMQRMHSWKITLAQARIGGESPRTASSLLLSGELRGSAMQRLGDGLLQIIRDLQALTKPDERVSVDQVREELAGIDRDDVKVPSKLSAIADKFVGAAIKKNYHHERGRFKTMRDLGARFRSGNLVLTESEILPAGHLGALLEVDADPSLVFASAPARTALDRYCGSSWYDVLSLAASLQGSAAVDCIWTCGLTDGGLHNMFLTEEKVWLFDLGEPAIMPVPAFLTKLLMSFFHTLGMEEGGPSGWVNRFVPGDRLTLTPETESALKFSQDAFCTLLDRLVDEIFAGDSQVRELLLEYVVLQLLSDAAFCLERWTQKGGGEERWRPLPLEKWLWRALWDLYIAGVVADNRVCASAGTSLQDSSNCTLL